MFASLLRSRNRKRRSSPQSHSSFNGTLEGGRSSRYVSRQDATEVGRPDGQPSFDHNHEDEQDDGQAFDEDDDDDGGDDAPLLPIFAAEHLGTLLCRNCVHQRS